MGSFSYIYCVYNMQLGRALRGKALRARVHARAAHKSDRACLLLRVLPRSPRATESGASLVAFYRSLLISKLSSADLAELQRQLGEHVAGAAAAAASGGP